MTFILNKDIWTSDSPRLHFQGTEAVRAKIRSEASGYPRRRKSTGWESTIRNPLYIGELKGRGVLLQPGRSVVGTRQGLRVLQTSEICSGTWTTIFYQMARPRASGRQLGQGFQLLRANCGHKTRPIGKPSGPRSAISCGRVVYPRISPAVIMSVVPRRRKSSWARSTRFKKKLLQRAGRFTWKWAKAWRIACAERCTKKSPFA